MNVGKREREKSILPRPRAQACTLSLSVSPSLSLSLSLSFSFSLLRFLSVQAQSAPMAPDIFFHSLDFSVTPVDARGRMNYRLRACV